MADNDADTESGASARSTAPQSEFTLGEVGIGAVVTFVGLLIAFLLPYLLV